MIQLKEVKDIDEKDDDDNNLLHYVVIAQDLETLKLILQKKPRLDANGAQFSPELDLAIDTLNIDDISALVQHGGNIDQRDLSGHTSLEWAAMGGDFIKTSLLLSLGADPWGVHPITEKSLFVQTIEGHATLDEKKEILNLLSNCGAGINGDLSNINLGQDVLDNLIVIGSKIDDHTITREMVGNAKVITSVKEFDAAVNLGVKFDYTSLNNGLQRLIKKGVTNQEVVALYDRVQVYLTAAAGNRVPNFKAALAHSVAQLWVFSKNSDLEKQIHRLPDDIQELITEEIKTLGKKSPS